MTITSSVPTQPCKLVHVRASASFSPFLSFNVLLATAPGDSLSCSYDQLANPYHVLAMEVTMCPSKAKLDVESFFRGCLHRVSWYISFFLYIYIFSSCFQACVCTYSSFVCTNNPSSLLTKLQLINLVKCES